MSTEITEANHLAERIEAARTECGMTLKALSDTSGIAYPTLRRKLQNKPSAFTVDEVTALAVALNRTFKIGFAA